MIMSVCEEIELSLFHLQARRGVPPEGSAV